MTNPVYIGTDGSASLDDAIGPAKQARSLMHRIGADRGGTVHVPEKPGHFVGLLGRWKGELNIRILSGRTRLCKHLEDSTAQVMIWFVYMPELIRCTLCAGEAARAVSGTPADDICDGCGVTVVGENMHTLTGEVTAQVRRGATTGPVLIHGGACTPCCEADKKLVDAAWGEGEWIEKKP